MFIRGLNGLLWIESLQLIASEVQVANVYEIIQKQLLIDQFCPSFYSIAFAVIPSHLIFNLNQIEKQIEIHLIISLWKMKF